MTPHELLRGFFAFFISAILGYAFFEKSDRETENLDEPVSQPRYTPYLSNTLLPAFVLVIILCGLIEYRIAQTAEVMIHAFFSIFLCICVYYLALLLLMPLLRKYIRARACAALWLIPNYLYVTQYSFMQPDAPKWIIHAPVNAIKIVFLVWLVGCCGILLWKTASHLSFRRQILKNARPVTDPDVLELWKQEQQQAGFSKAPYRLVTSPQAKTPLSIGFFKRSIRVILPEAIYSFPDLSLIFRHELVHIGRNDSGTKFFLTFCTAMCWFNPLMWFAMRRSADDLELSCDETVLLDADDAKRKQYANLLLHTAGDERGFTTCLSASANALRYRLKNIVKPRRRFSGTLTVMLVFFILIMNCGYVTLAYDAGTGADLVFDGMDPASCTIESINVEIDGEVYWADVSGEDALNQYLAGLEFITLTGNYDYSEEVHSITVIYHGSKGAFGVNLTDHSMKFTPLYDDRPQMTYYVDAVIDWDYLQSLLVINE